ncbi:PIG-L family deacetylase [Gammaproteobacteria bacterium]|jgi:LmbE family N-acetylglucosaminyl deacetylase|nr:PIG-L family deacetylase [Gammaproteobacteria bacterium]MDB9759042.1 PIG-L family deacetylase [Gammaproteobacteria bacterium]MDC1422821.1 PIG-L family deacetylase [Gammaproteobacteria bacterium]MDC1510679.1 PIG-L family deacetylase [Gammaproteobacteria bacterium]
MLNPENVLLPYSISDLPEGPWLVFAPHADDETYGMGGALLRAREAGIDTHVIVLTDGALGGERDGLIAIRRNEVEHAARELGLASLQCWDEPDRGLEATPTLVAKTAAEIAKISPKSVFFPGPLEAHPDHRAAAQLVWEALQSSPELTVTALSYEIGNQNPINRMIDTTAVIAEKARVMTCYNSQNTENNYEDLVLALDKGRTFTMPPEVGHCEGFYEYTEKQRDKTLREVVLEITELYF